MLRPTFISLRASPPILHSLALPIILHSLVGHSVFPPLFVLLNFPFHTLIPLLRRIRYSLMRISFVSNHPGIHSPLTLALHGRSTLTTLPFHYGAGCPPSVPFTLFTVRLFTVPVVQPLSSQRNTYSSYLFVAYSFACRLSSFDAHAYLHSRARFLHLG